MTDVYLRVLLTKQHVTSMASKYSMLVVIFSSFFVNSLAQSTLDSLFKETPQVSDSALPSHYMNIVAAYSEVNLDSAARYASRASYLALREKDTLQYVRAEYALGFLYRKSSRYREAIDHYENALNITKNNLDDPELYRRYVATLNGLGLSHYFLDHLDKALQYHFKSLDERLKGDDYAAISIAQNNIGLVFNKMSNYQQAIEYFTAAMDNKIAAGQADVEPGMVNLAIAYVRINKFNVAHDYFMAALDSCQLKECSSNVMYETYNGLGLLNMELENYDSARLMFEKAYEISNSNNSISSRLYAIHNIAKIYEEKGNYSEALNWLHRGNMAGQIGALDLMAKNYGLTADIYAQKEMWDSAYYNYAKYDSINRQVIGDSILGNIAHLIQQRNDAFMNAKDRQIIETSKESAERQKLLILSLVVIGLAFGILIILYRNNENKKKINKQLFSANQIIEEKNEQLRNINNVLEEKVKERTHELNASNEALTKSNMELDNFIYKTSHDIRGPLATLQGICNVALMDVRDDKAVDYLEKLNNTATKLNNVLSKLLIINQINNSIISPNPINFTEIITQIVSENQHIGNEKHIETKIEIDEDIQFRSDDDLIRIILSNLINNAFKFYRKSYSINSFVNISIIKSNIKLLIRVTDNGIGIDESSSDKVFEIFSKASEISDSAGLGLYLAKLATEKLEGKISLSKSKEGYTQFKVELPYLNSISLNENRFAKK